MIEAIVFSRDRPAQLDLLLRSVEEHLPGLFSPIHVVFFSSSGEFVHGYTRVQKLHSGVDFCRELPNFQTLVRNLLRDSLDHVVFFCDDDIVVRPFRTAGDTHPSAILLNQEILCVSLRLGTNTDICYPLRRKQEIPPFILRDNYVWYWNRADGDFGYPCSLDGHVFRRDQIRTIIGDESFHNPNSLEDVIARRCRTVTVPPKMACYQRSLICGVPVNRVNETHPNRYGETKFLDTVDLNEQFLLGDRLSLNGFQPSDINAAHVELPLRFE